MASDIDTLLRLWGVHYGQRERPEVRRHERTDHALARVAIAPGRQAKRARELMRRDGHDRRVIMGRSAFGIGRDGTARVVPMGFVDAIPCKETRSSGYQPERPVPPEIQRVESTVKALERSHLLRGLCLRATYCTEGDRETKRWWVTDEFRKVSHHAAEVTLAVLKNETAFGKVWVEARLSWAPQ